jgi:cysteine desulfurase
MRPEAWEAMAPFASEVFGNASGSHAIARRAKDALEDSRDRVAAVLGCRPSEVVFTSGGTESDNLAIKGRAFAHGPSDIVTTSIEHEAVLEAALHCSRHGSTVTEVGVSDSGLIDVDRLAAAIDDNTAVVSVMLANNETGVIQPVGQVVEAVGRRAVVHTDAVQAFATIEIDVEALGVDLLSLASHKFGGPKGAGVLYVRQGTSLEPIAHGGGQEFGRRSGTSNVMGAVGVAVAMEVAAADRKRVAADAADARHRFVTKLVGAGIAESTVDLDAALVTHANLYFPGVRNETLLVRLDRAGVAVSIGSSCASGAGTVSRVLTAMGVSETQARSSLRFSFGWTTSPDDGDAAALHVIEAVEGLQ